MNTRNKYIKHIRSFFLLLALLVTGSAAGWGQDDSTDDPESPDSKLGFVGYFNTSKDAPGSDQGPYKITNKMTYFPIPVFETTIYIPKGKSKKLFIRELYESGGMADLWWYKCWYLEENNLKLEDVLSREEDKDGHPGNQVYKTVNQEEKFDYTEYEFDKSRSVLRKATLAEGKDALFWSRHFYETYQAKYVTYFAKNSSLVRCKLPDNNEGFTVICDVSFYSDYENFTGFDPNDAGFFKLRLPQSFEAPTLAKRYKFHIRPAESNLIKENEPFEKYTIYAPKQCSNDNGINLQLARPLDNYYWKDDGDLKHIDLPFNPDYSKTMMKANGKDQLLDNGIIVELSNKKGEELVFENTMHNLVMNHTYQVFTLRFSGKTINDTTIFRVKSKDDPNIIFAEYTIIPVENAGFTTEVDMLKEEFKQPYHEPEKHPELYEEIGVVDFDSFEGMEEKMVKADEVLTKENNALAVPLDVDLTSYSFIYPSLVENHKMSTIFATKFTPRKNMYGLYRTAGVDDISRHSTTNLLSRRYSWYYPTTYPISINQETDEITYLDNDELDVVGENANTHIQIFDRTYRRYEKLKDSEEDKDKHQYGYFFYVDATQEPNHLITVPIDGTICEETELLVTAWINNMTSGNSMIPPNLEFHLVGTKNESENSTQERDILHRFTSGYANGLLCRWQQLCYTVVLSKDVIENYHNFQVEIYNNASHSEGNDFAIDDIRIYRKLVHASARQANSLCEDVNAIKVRMNYEELLSVLGVNEGDQIDEDLQPNEDNNKKYEGLYERLSKVTDIDLDKNMLYYRKLKYYLFAIDDDWSKLLKEEYPNKEGIDDICSEELVKSHDEKGEVTYYLNMELVRKIQDLGNDALGNCFRYADLGYYTDESTTSTHGYGVISTKKELLHQGTSTTDVLAAYNENDGNIYFQNIRLPENAPSRTYYMIYIPSEYATNQDMASFNDNCGIFSPFKLKKAEDLVTIVKEGGTEIDNVNDVNANGTYTLTGHFYARKTDTGDPEEIEGMTFDWFFGSYDDFMNPAKGIKDPESTDPGKKISIHEALEAYHGDDEGSHESKYLDVLKNFLGGKNVIVVDGQANPYDLKNEYKGKLIIHAKEVKITTPTEFTNQLLVVTPNPLEEYTNPNNETMYCIKPREVPLGGKTTVIPGDPDLPGYPSGYALGVRLGMGQITDMVGNDDGSNKQLQIPLYMVKPNNTENQKTLEYKLDDETEVKVSSSTDPDWNKEDVVAEIKELNVEYADGLQWDEDYFQLQFNETAKSFKEGYAYTLEVPYAEDVKITGKGEDVTFSETRTLTGTFHVTLKIVPEYVTWQGNANDKHNWNNDDMDHWKRSTAAELYDTDGTRAEKYNEGKDGTHYDNAYTPMRFTNVIIQNENAYSAYPYLYALNVQENMPILNMTAPADQNIGDATEYIEYDLAVDEKYWKILFDETCTNKDANLYTCVRFYGNTCNEIYFKPQTALLHAEHLTYKKAWIDYELDANRWYTLASPLKGIVAGDMYLPKGEIAGTKATYGVQKTPAFTDIKYGTDYTRWDPAVYMRGWDKSEGTVVVPGNGTGINYAIAGSWSNLYNKVSEPFTPATGFSIGVDADNDELDNNKVLFRLPKADTKYSYYPNGEGNAGDEETITRNGSGRLKLSDMKDNNNTISIETSNSDDDLKLIGNPFMAHLDMKKFFGESTTAKEYYILTEEGTETSIIGKDFSVSTAPDDATKVAPLQSFLVDKASLPQGGFTADMQTVANTDGTPGLRSAIVAEPKNKLPEIRITAERDGKRNTAVVAYLSYASESYKADEDASLLIDKEVAAPQVYTLADKQMLAINLTDRLHDIPVGVYGTSDSPVTLTFSLSDKIANVTLYDKQEKKSYNVTEGMTLTVAGNTSGRYFLNGSTPTANDVIARNEIVCYSSGNGQIVVSSVDPLTQVFVYDLSGKLFTGLTDLHTPTVHVQGLNPGQLYIVRAETANQVQSEKVEVR